MVVKSKMKYFYIIFLCFGVICLPSLTEAEDSGKTVRVAILKDADEITLTVSSPYKILSLYTNEELDASHILWNAKVLPQEWGVQIGKREYKVFGVRIQPQRSPSIFINGRKFRGAVDIIRTENVALTAINYVEIDEYVQGVLYNEVAPWWPMEALKAQAIVARSFALYQVRQNQTKEYDLVSTIYSQVYGGKTSERGRTSKAVALTKNEVLSFGNKLLPAFYHATCAGHTLDASGLWNIKIVPLRGRECAFCTRSPHYQWKAKFSLDEIGKSLEKANISVGQIQAIKVIERDVSGRIIDLEISSSKGVLKLDANRFRLAVGPNSLRSTHFVPEIKGNKVYFNGFGWGHGVGMCQWGAFFMSRKGFSAEEILKYYYPQSKIDKMDAIDEAN